MLFERAFLSQVKTASFNLHCHFSSTFSNSSSPGQLDMLQRFFLFAIHLEIVLLLNHISLWHFSSYFFLLQFSAYRTVYSFHYSHLFQRTSLSMEDTNFVILNISQGKHCIADITKKCFVGFVTKFGKEKWIWLKN